MDWMFCKKMDRGMFSISSSTVCPPPLLFTVGWLFVSSGRIIAKYILHTYCILAKKKAFVLLCQTSEIQLTISCCLFIFGILSISVFLCCEGSRVSLHCQRGTQSDHLWSSCLKLPFVYHNLFSPGFSLQSEHVICGNSFSWVGRPEAY